MSFLQSGSLAVNIGWGLVALAVLVLSSDQAVKRLEGLATYFNLSTTFMGMTVVALATSIPEISSHLTASVGILRGTLDREIASAVVLGANIGSDIVQQTFILGLVVFLAGGLYFRRYFMFKSMIPMIASTILCIVLGLDQVYSRWDGLILFGCFLAYTYYLYVDERKYYHKVETEEVEEQDAPETKRQACIWALITIACMALTVFSAQIVLNVTESIVQVTGVGGSLIGVLTLGVASALPEFTTAISGIRNKEHGIPLGTLIGSNITNPLVAIGGGALVSTYWVPRPLVAWDLPWATLTGIALFAIAWFRKGKLGRGGAIYLMALYFVYLILRVTLFQSDSYAAANGLRLFGWLA